MTQSNRKQQIEEMLAEEPGDAFLHYCLAMEYIAARDDTSAVAAFEKLIALDADYVPGYLQGGQALVRLGRVDDARKMFGHGIEAARRTGNEHAMGEMTAFLAGLE